MTDTPPPIPAHLTKATPWWNTKVPIWSFVPLLLLIFLILSASQRPLVEALWRRHHPYINDGMRAAIQKFEEKTEQDLYNEGLRRFQQGMETPPPQNGDQTSKWWQDQNDQYEKERAARRERLGLPPLEKPSTPRPQ